MSYVSVTFKVKDAEKFQEYGAQAGATFGKYGGEVLYKAPLKALVGETSHEMFILFKFPSAEKVDAWFNSPEYQALTEVRDAALDTVFITGQ